MRCCIASTRPTARSAIARWRTSWTAPASRYTKDEVRYLVGEIEKLKPFPEVPAALAKLQTKYRLVVLSNGDPDMLETAKRYHKHPVRPRHLRRRGQLLQAACRDLHQGRGANGLADGIQILFVANHAFDCIGAKSAGMRTAFIDRRSPPVRRDAASAGHPRADHEDLADGHLPWREGGCRRGPTSARALRPINLVAQSPHARQPAAVAIGGLALHVRDGRMRQ